MQPLWSGRLQWGRDLTDADGRAVHLHASWHRGPLQWGRDLTDADGPVIVAWLHCVKRASMGPRPNGTRMGRTTLPSP